MTPTQTTEPEEQEHHGIVVLGTTEFLPGFALAGIRRTVLCKPDDVLMRIDEHHDAAIIIVEDKLLASLSATERDDIAMRVEPVVITLAKDPSLERARLQHEVLSTLGVDLA